MCPFHIRSFCASLYDLITLFQPRIEVPLIDILAFSLSELEFELKSIFCVGGCSCLLLQGLLVWDFLWQIISNVRLMVRIFLSLGRVFAAGV